MERSSTRIHPTAVLSPMAELAPDVTVGAFAVLEGQVRLGPGCVIGLRAHLIGPLTMGQDNYVFNNAAIGGCPQHLQYRDEPAGVEVGDGNTFRENVTVHSGTLPFGRTLIGSGNYFMAGSHVGHDCEVGDHCTLADNGLLGGHCVLADGVHIGAASAVHQSCRLGRLAVLDDVSSATVDIPPFVVQRERNVVVGVNVGGMRRAGLSEEQIDAVRRCYDTVYLCGLVLTSALDRLEGELGAVDVVREFMAFARESRRGIGRAAGKSSDAVTCNVGGRV
jgi:UDP-N-acetylglucosamine acyltransferase